jgi:uncharacterized RDD family membrane protein YckC
MASFDGRLSAFLIDGLILAPASIAVFVAAFADVDVLRAWFLWALIWHVYFGSFWSRLGHGQTPGMRVRGIRVVREDGGDLDFRRAFIRAATLFFGSGLGIVPLSVLLDRDAIGLHDRAAGSRVIRIAARDKRT